MDSKEISQRIKQVLTNRFNLGIQPEVIACNEAIFGTGLGLDSMAAIEVIIGIEKAFGIHIEDEDMTLNNFGRIDTLAALIQQKLAC